MDDMMNKNGISYLDALRLVGVLPPASESAQLPPMTAPDGAPLLANCHPTRLAPSGFTGNPDIDNMLLAAVNRYNAMSPQQQAEMWQAQRDGWKRHPEQDDTGPVDGNPEVIPPFECVYTNWRGETRRRRLLIRRAYWGANQWHRDEQMLVDAYDCDTGDIRSFALSQIVPKHIADAHDARMTELLDANNSEVEKRRMAEAEANKWRQAVVELATWIASNPSFNTAQRAQIHAMLESAG